MPGKTVMTPTIAALQYITYEEPTLELLRQTERILDAGVKWIQLRVKGFSDAEFFEVACRMRTLCFDHGATFIVNDNVEIAAKCGAHGVHLGKNDCSPDQARILLGESAIIGGTANSISDLHHLVAQRVSYIGLGPLRDTTTKVKLSPILGIDGIREFMDEHASIGTGIPVIAVGGVTFEDISKLKELNIYGVAMCGALRFRAESSEGAGELCRG
jgi:thiamine-phosphate pyrophosphorylase